jgi:anti-sigma factor RsiW
MTCRKAAQFIDDFVDGELGAELKQEVQRHLALCEKCRNNAAESIDLKSMLKSYAIAEPAGGYFNKATGLILDRCFGGVESVYGPN